MNTVDNRTGKQIRIIIGTDVAGEGIDMKRVRGVHLIDPWFNTTKTYQTIGRGARHCSHIDLPENQRNVEVFRYSTRPPDLIDDLPEHFDTRREIEKGDYQFTLGDVFRESVDEHVYNTALHKDILTKSAERVLKEMSIDCNLSKALNVFATDIDGTRGCDYQECDYQCQGVDGDLRWGYDPPKTIIPNRDTYNIRFSQSRIDKAAKFILAVFQRFYALKLEDIESMLQQRDSELETNFIHEALRRILGDQQYPPSLTRDRYGRAGYIIYRGGYYIFQPKDLEDERIPMYYRQTPLTKKKHNISVMMATRQETVARMATRYVDTEYLLRQLAHFNNVMREGEALDMNTELLMEYDIDLYIPILSFIDQLTMESQKFLVEELATGDYLPDLKNLIFTYYYQQQVLYRLPGRHELVHIMATDGYRYFDGRAWSDQNQLHPGVSELKEHGMARGGSKGPLSGYSSYNRDRYIVSLMDKASEHEQARQLTRKEQKELLEAGKSLAELNIDAHNQRFRRSGKACTSYPKSDLIKFMRDLGMEERDDLTNQNRCYIIEMKLRQLDRDKFDQRRYFTNYLEQVVAKKQ